MAATAASLSSIVTPAPPSSSSSSSSFSPITSNKFFTHLSPNFPYLKPKPFKNPLTLKSQNFTLSPLPLLFPLHIRRSSAAFNDVQDSITDELEEDPDEEEQGGGEESDGEAESDDGREIKGSSSYSVDDCRLFVGNLPFSMTSSQLSEAFAEAGQVRFAEVIYDKVTDRSRGFGFVTMGSIDEAKEAIRMFDGSQIGGRTVKVNFPEVPRGGERKVMGPKIRSSNQSFVDTPHKIYVGNLGWGVTTQGLRDAFAGQPGFLSAKVIYERDTGRSRGFGFISFSSAEAAQSALNSFNGVELEGRPMRLNMAAERARTNTEAIADQSEALSTERAHTNTEAIADQSEALSTLGS